MAELTIDVLVGLTDDQRKEIDKFIKNNWGKNDYDTPEEVANNFFAKPTYRLIGMVNSELMALLDVFERKIIFEHHEYLMAGIGGVLTEKNNRQKGYATKLLKYCMEKLLPKDGVDVAMLCTDIAKLGGLYGQVGFVSLGRKYYFWDKNGVERSESGGMIASVNNQYLVNRIVSSIDKLFVGESNF